MMPFASSTPFKSTALIRLKIALPPLNWYSASARTKPYKLKFEPALVFKLASADSAFATGCCTGAVRTCSI